MAEEQGSPRPSAPSGDAITITLTHHNKPYTFALAPTSTLSDLSAAVASKLSIPPSNQKYLVPKLGLLKPPFDATNADDDDSNKNNHHETSTPLAALQNKRITLMGTTSSELSSLHSASAAAASRAAALASARRTQPPVSRRRDNAAADSTYAFLALRALRALPSPERSHAFLARLAADPGVRAAMRAHRFTVGLLTEMDPLAHTRTTAGSDGGGGVERTLGLNRNRGEVVELRLRTDAGDGYRDYRTVRRTLCHELAHNVWADHDARFWDLCRRIEGEVERADWRSGGRRVQEGDYYDPDAATPAGSRDRGLGEGEVMDHGGWTGGEFVLGSGENPAATAAATAEGAEEGSQGGSLSRREIMARAAEERIRRRTAAEARRREGESDPGGSSSEPL